ncbi:hypothetical protein [Polaribacter sp. M15]
MEGHIQELKGANFENLMNRARKLDRRLKKHSKMELKKLFKLEDSKIEKERKEYHKQLITIKKSIGKACNIFLIQKNLNDGNKKNINTCLEELEYLTNTNEVYETIEYLLKNTSQFK